MPLENTFLLLEFKKIYVYEVFFEYLIGGIKLGAFFFSQLCWIFQLTWRNYLLVCSSEGSSTRSSILILKYEVVKLVSRLSQRIKWFPPKMWRDLFSCTTDESLLLWLVFVFSPVLLLLKYCLFRSSSVGWIEGLFKALKGQESTQKTV